jgi:hypothetical protein
MFKTDVGFLLFFALTISGQKQKKWECMAISEG